ncbi:MAG: DUF362 domain-containing protein [Deltaproteobacteria bacterium]|nr:DUF362 domain-containing protein [Deltaproteobacteria bacterium]
MAASVYFIDFKATYKENMFTRFNRLMNAAGITQCFQKRDLVAIKLHFGETGNAAFIRPVYIRRVVNAVKSSGGTPFLTDANTLYAGTRGDTPHHLITALSNGFAYPVVDAPIVIADGLRGKSETRVSVNMKHFKSVYIGSEIAEADALISVAHFKGHELAGFGGALKNIGMGCASRRGKMAQHSDVAPKVKKKKCIGCGECAAHCAQSAISIIEEKAVIDGKKCIGCGECILICEQGAIQIQWSQSVPVFQESMVEYAAGVLKTKPNKSLFINFINQVSPGCDCLPYNDTPIVRDIGIAASLDPVAIDQACVDLVNNEPALPGSCLTTNTGPGEDKFKGVYPGIEWRTQLEYAEEIGLGTREYELIKL